MIAFDLVYELTLGAACVLHREANTAPRRVFRHALLLSAVYCVVCVGSLATWPGWQSMYLLDLDGSAPRLAIAEGLQVTALMACFFLGFVRVGPMLRRFDVRRVHAFAAIAWLFLLAFLFVALRDRAFIVTTFRDFSSRTEFALSWGRPDSVLGGAVMYFLIVSAALNLGGAATFFARSSGEMAARTGAH